LPANTKVFEIPLVSVAVADSTAQGFLVGFWVQFADGVCRASTPHYFFGLLHQAS
jgi:hypothetical protein